MNRTLLINNTAIDYKLKISERARTIRLAVYHDGSFVVTAPYKIKENIVEKFILDKSNWILEKINHFKNNPKKILPKHNKKEIGEYKEKANGIVQKRLKHFNQFYNFTYKNITIKNTKSRWGSCSKQGNLNFNYKIALLPTHLSDYIIVHELCHLDEMNHSPNFWKLVTQTIPDYKNLRKELKLII
jgi:hypothetical protein